MQVEQKKWSKAKGWNTLSHHTLKKQANLVLVFGSTRLVQDQRMFDEIRAMYPTAEVVLSSGAGEIMSGQVDTDTLHTTAIYFECTTIKTIEIDLKNVKDSFDAGAHISAQLDKDRLCGLMIFSNGNLINGSHLLTGLQLNLSESIPITGGLAGSYSLSSSTYTGLNHIGQLGKVVGIGLYGHHLKIGHASKSGYTPFGPEIFITKSSNNVLFELNNEPIFDFYKKYVDTIFEDIEEAMCTYPLGIKIEHQQERLLRSFVRYNKKNRGAIFAGDMPEGAKVRMMRSNIHLMIDAAKEATIASGKNFGIKNPDLLLCVSCIRRKTVLDTWVNEEMESVHQAFDAKVPMAGFYSYGEIAPQSPNQKSELHNHTITITALEELV